MGCDRCRIPRPCGNRKGKSSCVSDRQKPMPPLSAPRVARRSTTPMACFPRSAPFARPPLTRWRKQRLRLPRPARLRRPSPMRPGRLPRPRHRGHRGLPGRLRFPRFPALPARRRRQKRLPTAAAHRPRPHNRPTRAIEPRQRPVDASCGASRKDRKAKKGF